MELGQINLMQLVSLITQFCSVPHKSHMAAVLHIFGYVKGHLNSKVILDPVLDFKPHWLAWRCWVEGVLLRCSWSYPTRCSKPQGKDVQISIYCDATCLAMYRLITGVIVFLNGVTVKWYSKWQNRVESGTLNSEFVALKISTEMKCTIQYKLWMMGVPIEGHLKYPWG